VKFIGLDLPQRIPPQWQMFLLSFTALFLELMVIRWVPSVVRLVAYYANLMLLSSFLGLGVGAMAGNRKWRLFGWFPVLLAGYIVALLLSRQLALGSSGEEMRFGALPLQLFNYAILIGLFVANALVFVPVGQQMGALFTALPRLKAYAWDLGGSLCGTLCFGLFSLLHFSPVLGMAVVMLLYLSLVPWRHWRWAVPVFGLVLFGMFAANDRATLWSPYYHIVVRDIATTRPLTEAPPDLATMKDPPLFVVSVNQDFYHIDGAQNPARYSPGSHAGELAAKQRAQYQVPYLLAGPRQRVLVVGAGGGADVQGALTAGASYIDAVEIDPVVADISRHFNADAPYTDPRVHLHVDDARSFLSKASPDYDLITFGYLDSQALFSSMSNLRLDGYVYTVESIRTAYGLLNEKGVLTLSFGYGQHWLLLKLYRMVVEATGRVPIFYESPGHVVFCVPKTVLPAPPPRTINGLDLAMMPAMPQVEPATDDWPFLYLARRTVPSDYLIVIGGLLLVSLLAVGTLRGRSFGRSDAHFALLGMGFLLLETKSISDCSLYFGATWLVTLLVVTGVLLMVLASNVVAGRVPRFSLWFYAPLFAVLVLLVVVPREQVLAFSLAGRLAWTLLVVPLPVFFAGLIFSTGFREAANPAVLFGANLIGAMIGGFAEYLGMAVGSHHLSYLVIAAYAGSLLCLLRNRGGAATTTAPA
jgi:MFS family permease